VDFKDQVLAEAGDLIEAISAGVITPNHVYAQLGEIVTGQKAGRTDHREITLFKSVGVALEDVVTAAFVYDQAVAKGLGTQVVLDGAPNDRDCSPRSADSDSQATSAAWR
jgi:ornithine cyclodeaminase/alanine dehydrogenase-like protein (mu-crystallin family)